MPRSAQTQKRWGPNWLSASPREKKAFGLLASSSHLWNEHACPSSSFLIIKPAFAHAHGASDKLCKLSPHRRSAATIPEPMSVKCHMFRDESCSPERARGSVIIIAPLRRTAGTWHRATGVSRDSCWLAAPAPAVSQLQAVLRHTETAPGDSRHCLFPPPGFSCRGAPMPTPWRHQSLFTHSANIY